MYCYISLVTACMFSVAVNAFGPTHFELGSISFGTQLLSVALFSFLTHTCERG